MNGTKINSALSMTGTFSKHPRAWGLPDDTQVRYGRGSRVVLNDEQTYIDWVSGLGSNLLGYSNEVFIARVQNQVSAGAGFSLPHTLEQMVAEKLVYRMEGISGWKSKDISVRFGKTGSDATEMAVRLARAVTGRSLVLQCGYSGWGSEFIAAMPPAHGIPFGYKEHIATFQFNDMASLEKAAMDRKVAAIIIEQGVDEPEPRWYEFLRRFCDDEGVVFILDEIVTGLRFGLQGVAGQYGIEPDLIVMGKALGNGLPISALVGRREYLDWFNRDDPVFCSSTHWGEAISLAAASAVLDIWGEDEVNQIWGMGKILMDYLNANGWKTVGHPPRSLMVFEDDYERGFFIQSMYERGILMNRPNFPNLGHTDEDLVRTLHTAGIVRQLRDKMEKAEVVSQVKRVPHVLFKNR